MSDHENITAEPLPFPIETDFETYEVPAERATLIREELQTLKAKTWLGDLFAWVKETGAEVPAEQGELLDGSPAKHLIWPAEHPLHMVEIILDGADLELKLSGTRFAVVQSLPKGEDVLISHYASELKATFAAHEEALQSELKIFTKSKAEKNRLIQERLAASRN